MISTHSVAKQLLRDNMSKRTRHPQGFYASLLSDVRDHSFTSKYRPKAKPSIMGVYEVEHIVAKRIKGGKAEYIE